METVLHMFIVMYVVVVKELQVFITFILEIRVELVSLIMKSSITATKNTINCDGTRWEPPFEFNHQLIYGICRLDEWQFQVINANVDQNVLW